MSQQLINHSPDLKRLRDEGYDVAVQSNYLLIRRVPYVNSNREVKRGILISELSLAGDVTTAPSTHVVYFTGDHPCNKDGSLLMKIKHQSEQQRLGPDLVANHSFSSKPSEGYKDYYEKMSTYATIISSPAESIDPRATATVFPIIEAEADHSVFNYMDTASSRAGIQIVSRKLELAKVGIIGLGGTGSYVLDLVAKTPIKEIHLFDGDQFLQHNAFRSPGAPSLDELRAAPKKVVYFKSRYAHLHRHIVANDCFIDASNIEQLRGMSFVFLCLDSGSAKKVIVEKLEDWAVPFIDVGMGVELVDDALGGILRITTSIPKTPQSAKSRQRISFSERGENNDYSRNIQIADLNALNATLAVVKWKKLCGFYRDLEKEHTSVYTIDGNILNNEDQR